MKVGDKFEIEYPFQNQLIDTFEGKKHYWVTPGCHRHVEHEDCGWGYGEVVFWTANFEGKIIYEVLAVVEMPGKYMDRIIVKYHYKLPNGEKFAPSKVKTFTAGKLKKQIDNDKAFPCEYEIDEDYKQ